MSCPSPTRGPRPGVGSRTTFELAGGRTAAAGIVAAALYPFRRGRIPPALRRHPLSAGAVAARTGRVGRCRRHRHRNGEAQCIHRHRNLRDGGDDAAAHGHAGRVVPDGPPSHIPEPAGRECALRRPDRDFGDAAGEPARHAVLFRRTGGLDFHRLADSRAAVLVRGGGHDLHLGCLCLGAGALELRQPRSPVRGVHAGRRERHRRRSAASSWSPRRASRSSIRAA